MISKPSKKITKDLFCAVQPIYFLAKVLCVCPFKLSHENTKFVMAKLDYLTVILQILFSSYIVCDYLTASRFTFKSSMSAVTYIVICFQLSLFYILHFLNVTTFIVHRKDIIKLFTTARLLDKIMLRINVKTDYGICSKNCIKLMLVFTGVNIFTFFIYFTYTNGDFGLLIISSIVNLIFGIVFCFLSLFLFDLKTRYLKTNERFKFILAVSHEYIHFQGMEKSYNNREAYNKYNYLEELSHIVLINKCLCRYSKQINNFISPALIVVLTDLFISIIASIYYSIEQSYKIPDAVNIAYNIVTLILWNSFQIVLCVFTVYITNRIYKQVFNIVIILWYL